MVSRDEPDEPGKRPWRDTPTRDLIRDVRSIAWAQFDRPDPDAGQVAYAVAILAYAVQRLLLPETSDPVDPFMLTMRGEATEEDHRCPLPPIPASGVVALRPNWECAVCGRVWHQLTHLYGGASWREIRGPCRAGNADDLPR